MDEENAVTPNRLDNSLHRRRNTCGALPELVVAKPPLFEVLGASSGPRHANTIRRSTAPEVNWHTPPASMRNSVERATIATHAASEPQHTTASRPPLNPSTASRGPPVLPLVGGAVHTNTAIARSARLPLAVSPSPASSTASTPRASHPATNWNGRPYPPTAGSAAAATASASLSDPAPTLSSRKAGLAAEKLDSPTGISTNKTGPGGRASTTPSSPPTAAATTTAGRNGTPPHVREKRQLSTAIKSFNQCLLEESEKERARLSRHSSRTNSRATSMSDLTVSRTQPPSASPSPPLKPTPPNATEPSPQQSPRDKTTVGRLSSNAVRAPPQVGRSTGPAPASSPPTSTSKTPVGTGPKPAPAAVSLVPSTQSVKASATSSPPSHPSPPPQPPVKAPAKASTSSRLSGGAPHVPLSTTANTNGSSPFISISSSSISNNAPAKKTTPLTAATLPSRYADYYDDEASKTPPQATPTLPKNPVFSAVEVKSPTPLTSLTTSARRGLPGFAAVVGDSKKDSGVTDVPLSGPPQKQSASTNNPNGSSTSGGAQSSSPRTAPPQQQPQQTQSAPIKAPVIGMVNSHTLDDLDDAAEDAATPTAGEARKNNGVATTAGAGQTVAAAEGAVTAAKHGEHKNLVRDDDPLDSGDSLSPLQQYHPAKTASLPGSSKKINGSLPAPVIANKRAQPSATLPFTTLAVFSSQDNLQTVKGDSPLTASKSGPPPPPPPAAAGAKATGFPRSTPQPIPTTATVRVIAANKSDSGSQVSPAPWPVPTASASPLTLANGVHAIQHRPSSALTRNGRYATSRSRDGQGPLGNGDAYSPSNLDGSATGADAEAEAATLCTYLKEEELNLSMSTFNSVGPTLAQSLNLRVLNLNGSTISSEGLRGLANIPTLRSVCVSHMRNLTSLKPLVTPTVAGARCTIEEIDAQFSAISNDGVQGVEKVRRLRRLDLSMTPVSDVTCLAGSVSLSDLYLTGTRVDSAGVAGLERVPTLITLNIARTKVTSLAQLAKSRSLQTLILYSCHVNDAGFVGVSEMPRLATLDVSTTKIEDLSVLQKSRTLKSIKAQWLSLKNCQDIIQERRSQMDGPPPGDSMEWRDTEAGFAGLAAIATLETLDLSFNTLHSVHSLCRSKSLKHLFLKRTRMENSGIGSIAQLAPTLETLVITNLADSLDDEDDEHEVESNTSGLLSVMGDIHLLLHLTSLDLSFTDVFDLRLLQNLRTLKELIIVETLVTVDGLRGVEKIPSLELLDISQTSIVSLQFLVGGAPTLKTILARSNRNTSGFVLGQVHKLPALEHLDVSDSVVEDMESVPKQSWRLKELVWRWGERRDNKGLAPPLECWVTSPRLVGLREMPCLSLLDLTSSRVHELSFLAKAPCLKTLNLKLCKLLRNSSIKELGSLAALEVLQLSDNAHITDVTCLRSCRKLRELQLNNTRVSMRGLEEVMNLPELKVLNIVNTRAEDEAMNSGVATECSRLLEDSNLRDGSAVLDNTATPAQFRVPRRRRVSFIVSDGGEASSKASPL
ncbi:hypothetical protein ABB37_06781 [Leptomonas pyrrhocoris]|uniref:Leucine-rich repeat protein n=1 Tax=Leptomonas pyrrhocoris TaxID=157538 RepID=A0A0N0VEJ8_LEPPY|nr:hypothetical protein ABB37_06781 [Leptomonas pyrrhocoris]KPA78032.1 hypothetical protein ABB37_06781 [Leptomonas pyrrhocoris]|eukprot:XP_015656471.1 hypothetical protein ABB37_06781 [Leptomonas pyrrhocoris]